MAFRPWLNANGVVSIARGSGTPGWNPLLRRTLKGFCPSQAQSQPTEPLQGSIGEWILKPRVQEPWAGRRNPVGIRRFADSPRRGSGGWAIGRLAASASWWIATTPTALLAEAGKARVPAPRQKKINCRGPGVSLRSTPGDSGRRATSDSREGRQPVARNYSS